MGRYDAFDTNSGYGSDKYGSDGVAYSKGNNSIVEGKEGAPKRRARADGGNNNNNSNSKKKAASVSGPTPTRGRSLSRGRSFTRGRSTARSVSAASQSSSKSKSGFKAGLQVRSLARSDSKSVSSKSSKKSQAKKGSSNKAERGRSATPNKAQSSSNVVQRSQSATRKQQQDSGINKRTRHKKRSGGGGHDLEDEKYSQWSVGSRESFENGFISVGSVTHDNKTKFTNVTVEPFLPRNIVVGDGGGCSSYTITLGQSLYSDVMGITSWEWNFTVCQLLSGLTVVLNQVPECISYAYIAGMDPFHAMQATWISNVLTPIVGGRPGMLCGSSGLGAIAIRFVVANYGPEYVFYAVILSGFCQVLFGGLRIGKYLRLLPPGITIGMVNALCLLMVALQLRYFKMMPDMMGAAFNAATSMEQPAMEESSSTMEEPTRHLEQSYSSSYTFTEDGLNQPWAYFLGYDLPWTKSNSQMIIVSVEAAFAMLICWFVPKFIVTVPSSLIALVLLTCANIGIRELSDYVAPNVGDYCLSEIPTSRFWQGIYHSSYSLPPLFEWDTLSAVIPCGLSLFCINLLETMVAINVVDNYTGTDSEQDRVFYGQGVSNLACGLMAGMGGTGMAHTSLYNLRMGGVTSISSFFAGIIMLSVLTYAYPAFAQIPLGGVMGVTLYLIWNMIQWSPMVAFVLKFIPNKCLAKKLKLGLKKKRKATPDLFSTFVTSIFALTASTYGFAGYLIGVLCYACDPIAHAIISGDNTNTYSFIELNLSKPPVPKRMFAGWRERRRANRSRKSPQGANAEGDEDSEDIPEGERGGVSVKADSRYDENFCDIEKNCGW